MDITTSLHIACMLNDAPRVKHLLTRGAHPHAENTSGTTALQLADFLRRLEIIKLLLHDIDIVTAGGYELLKAIRADHATVVRALLEMGVGDELRADEGFYRGVLVMACCISSLGVLEALVLYGPAAAVGGLGVENMDVLVQCAVAAGNWEVVDGIREIVACERGIQNGNVMESTDKNSPAPSVAESVAEDSLYGMAPGWDPTLAVDEKHLFMQSVGQV